MSTINTNIAPWKTLKSEKGEDLIIFNVRYDHVVNPRNQTSMKAIVLESNDSANVVAITKTGKVLMVKQYRFGTQKITIELPGGFIDDKEDSSVAVARELQEETGYSSNDWTYLGRVESNPVFMNSYVHHWLAKGVSYQQLPQLDEGEDIQLMLLSVDEIKQHIKAGAIAHPHTISALARVFPLWS